MLILSFTEINSPKSITIHSALQYPHFPCSNVNAAKEEIYHNAKTDLQCGQNGTCQIQVDIKGIITTKSVDYQKLHYMFISFRKFCLIRHKVGHDLGIETIQPHLLPGTIFKENNYT